VTPDPALGTPGPKVSPRPLARAGWAQTVALLMAAADLDGGDRRSVMLGSVVVPDDPDVDVAGLGLLDQVGP